TRDVIVTETPAQVVTVPGRQHPNNTPPYERAPDGSSPWTLGHSAGGRPHRRLRRRPKERIRRTYQRFHGLIRWTVSPFADPENRRYQEPAAHQLAGNKSIDAPHQHEPPGSDPMVDTLPN